jgi:hypothetical protein
MFEDIQYVNSGMIRYFDQFMTELISKDSVTILTNERYTSVFHADNNVREKARRIHELQPNPKVMIMIQQGKI